MKTKWPTVDPDDKPYKHDPDQVALDKANIIRKSFTSLQKYGLKSPTQDDIAKHVNSVLDELKWLNAHDIKLHIRPTKNGWNLKLTAPD